MMRYPFHSLALHLAMNATEELQRACASLAAAVFEQAEDGAPIFREVGGPDTAQLIPAEGYVHCGCDDPLDEGWATPGGDALEDDDEELEALLRLTRQTAALAIAIEEAARTLSAGLEFAVEVQRPST